MLSACGGNNDQNDSSNNGGDSANQDAPFSIADISFELGSEEANECANSISLDFLDEDAINEIRSDGLAVRETIENSYPIDLTFCGSPTSSATLEKLDEFDSLMAEGQTEQALQLIADYVLELERELLSAVRIPHLASLALSHDFGQTRIFVREMLTIAGRLQQQGLEDEADIYINKAREAFRIFGFEELALIEDDYKQALAIAGEAQGLGGLGDLSQAALAKAREIIERQLPPAFEKFDACISTKADMGYLDELFTYGQGIGVEAAQSLAAEFYFDKLEKWGKVQEKRARGDNVPECPNTYKINIDMVVDDSANMIIFNWQGLIQVDENQDIKGNMSGTLVGNLPEMECLLFTASGTETVFNPTTYKGAARITLTGKQIGADESAELQIFSPEDNLANASIAGTYGNDDCGGNVEYDFVAQIFKALMASPMTFIGYGMGSPITYLELSVSTPQTVTISALVGDETVEYIITLQDQSDND